MSNVQRNTPELYHYKGNLYEVVSDSQMRNEKGDWVAAIAYKPICDPGNSLYVRNANDFYNKFKRTTPAEIVINHAVSIWGDTQLFEDIEKTWGVRLDIKIEHNFGVIVELYLRMDDEEVDTVRLDQLADRLRPALVSTPGLLNWLPLVVHIQVKESQKSSIPTHKELDKYTLSFVGDVPKQEYEFIKVV